MKTEWTTQREKACINIANRAEASIWLFNETGYYYKKINTILLLGIVCANLIFGSAGVLSVSLGYWPHLIYLNLCAQILIILTGAFGAVIKGLDLEEKITKCRNISFRYSILFLDIKKEINKDIKKRIDFDIFYEKINSESIELKYDIVQIPSSILKKYEIKFGDRAIKYKDLFIDYLEMDREVYQLDKFV